MGYGRCCICQTLFPVRLRTDYDSEICHGQALSRQRKTRKVSLWNMTVGQRSDRMTPRMAQAMSADSFVATALPISSLQPPAGPALRSDAAPQSARPWSVRQRTIPPSTPPVIPAHEAINQLWRDHMLAGVCCSQITGRRACSWSSILRKTPMRGCIQKYQACLADSSTFATGPSSPSSRPWKPKMLASG